MTGGTAEIIRGDARHLPLADNSVDLVVTSPPYFALRSYQDGGEHYDGQIGAEATPAEFVAALVEATRECVRVLKPSGSLWVNLGDKYAASPSGPQGATGGLAATGYGDRVGGRRKVAQSVPNKSLHGIPWRYALACIDDLGLILRAEVIWSKPNGLPESVTDRVRRSHEQWFHFTLAPRYFSAVDEIREQYDAPPSPWRTKGKSMNGGTHSGDRPDYNEHNPLGKLPGSVWTVPTEPLRVPDHLGVDHFAAFPTEWPKRIIQGWSPAGVCVECGEGRRPVVLKGAPIPVEEMSKGRKRPTNKPTGPIDRGEHSQWLTGSVAALSGQEWNAWKAAHPDSITGYACACPEPTANTTPAVILDPFGGTGTTALVAKALGRHGISVDMSADYCRLAEWRTNDRDQLAKVLGIAKAEQQPDDQLTLWEAQ